jgi:hypothetical protein
MGVQKHTQKKTFYKKHRLEKCLQNILPKNQNKGALGKKNTPTEVGGCFFWEFPEKHQVVFRVSQDAPPQ